MNSLQSIVEKMRNDLETSKLLGEIQEEISRVYNPDLRSSFLNLICTYIDCKVKLDTTFLEKFLKSLRKLNSNEKRLLEKRKNFSDS